MSRNSSGIISNTDNHNEIYNSVKAEVASNIKDAIEEIKNLKEGERLGIMEKGFYQKDIDALEKYVDAMNDYERNLNNYDAAAQIAGKKIDELSRQYEGYKKRAEKYVVDAERVERQGRTELAQKWRDMASDFKEQYTNIGSELAKYRDIQKKAMQKKREKDAEIK